MITLLFVSQVAFAALAFTLQIAGDPALGIIQWLWGAWSGLWIGAMLHARLLSTPTGQRWQARTDG